MASRLILDSSSKTLEHAMWPSCMERCRPTVYTNNYTRIYTHTHTHRVAVKSKSICWHQSEISKTNTAYCVANKSLATACPNVFHMLLHLSKCSLEFDGFLTYVHSCDTLVWNNVEVIIRASYMCRYIDLACWIAREKWFCTTVTAVKCIKTSKVFHQRH